MVEHVQVEPLWKEKLNIINMNNNIFLNFLINCKKRIAFTLAEVLITLLIIGIVASLIIPGLIADTQKQEDYTRLLKAVSVIQNAANLVRMENGGRMAGVANTSLDFANLFAPKLNYIKFCASTIDSENCYIRNSADMYTLNGGFVGNLSPYPYSVSPKIVTNDGFIYIFVLMSSTCQGDHYIVNGNPQNCGWILVDINGIKPPNTWGKDVFRININDHNAMAAGDAQGNDPTVGCKLSGTTDIWNGRYCAGKAIIEKGIKYY